MPVLRMLSLYMAMCFLFASCAFLDKKPIENNLPSPQPQPQPPAKSLSANEKVLMAKLDTMSARIDLLEQQLKEQKSENSYLSRSTDTLELELNKRNAIIHLQENVIKLLDDPEKTIEKGLKDEINAQLEEIENAQEHAKYIFYVADLFNPKTVEISPKGKDMLLSLVDLIKDNHQQKILVEGHTDNIPVGRSTKKKYPSNWEISLARAAAVVRFLQDEGGLEPDRLIAVGHGPYRPITSNKTEKGRQKNRRVEIILGPPM